MENIEFDEYVRATLSLARTLVVKIEAVALRENSVLEAAGYLVGNDKKTWRYYMNLNGDYHETDTPMWINSIDTGENILFNKENMAFHIATFREYSKGGYWFKRISEAYPGQVELIKGILKPIPYETTIAAENYKILSYNKSLVLWNEDHLIPKLQQFIHGLVPQLFNHEYIYTDNLMLPVTGVMTLYMAIIEEIATIRHESIGSRHAHDFYIWARIDSYGEFSKYKESLTKTQIMWLYNNIAWIDNNPGAQYTFDFMLKNLLTDADIPLAKFDLVENTKTQLVDLTPTPLYRKMNINLQDKYGLEPTYINTQQMILKEQGLAKDNYNQSAIWYDHALRKGTHSIYSELPTKVLESKMMDYTNRHINTKMSVTFNNWIYLAGKGYYNGKVLVRDPKTGKDVRLAVGDAYYIWRHLTNIASDRVQTYICGAYYQNVMKAIPPTLDELIQIGGPQFIPLYMAFDIRALWVPRQIFVSPEFLMEQSDEIYGVMWKHTKLYSQFYDLNKRARVRNTTEAMYESGFVELTTATTYEELLDRYEMDVSDHSPEEAQYFAWEIFKRVTGWDTSSNPSLRVRQNALIDIMMQLSSYTIQTVKEMDDGQDITELPNEIFVGDSRWTGPGNASDADFTNVGIRDPSNLDTDYVMDYGIILPLPDEFKTDAEADLLVEIITTEGIVPVDPEPDLMYYAVRIQDTSYIRLLPEPAPDIPETDYGRLVWPSRDAQKTLPETDYGRLQWPAQEGTNSIPETNYGRLSWPDETP
jgi:hypothetical protein